MTYAMSSRLNFSIATSDAIQRFINDGKMRRSIEGPDGSLSDHSVADGSARPLISLGLIAEDSAHRDRVELTEIGLAVCRDYWRRSDADDPTLPQLNIRAT